MYIFFSSPSDHPEQNPDSTEQNPDDTEQISVVSIAPDPAFKSIATQTESVEDVLVPLIPDLYAKINNLKSTVELLKHSVENVKDDKTMQMLTGFTKQKFDTIFDFFNLDDEIDNAKHLFFMFMVRLRNGVSEHFLGYMFGMSQSWISVQMNSIMDLIYHKIKEVKIWPSKEKVKKHMPPLFKKYFPSCRVIIDSTEFKIQKPSDPEEQQITFSYYKNSNTLKCMIGISPSGAVSFISPMYGGAISDKVLFLRSNLLQLLESGDSVLADRGFTVTKELSNIGCKLHTPLFLKDKIQFNLVERRENKKIARHRVHVERAIGSIKNFKLFKGAIPITMLHSVSKLLYIVVFLTNFGNPLLKY